MKALEKILVNDKPYHLYKTGTWGVPAYWIETQFTGEEEVPEIIKRFLIWLRHGLSKKEIESINTYKENNQNLNFEDFRWGIWSYCEAVCGLSAHREIVDELFPEIKKLPKGDRVDVIVPSYLDK